MLEVSGCLGNEKETSVGEIGEMYDSTKCMWWVRKKKKYWHVNKSVKSICVYKRKKKNHRHNKIWSWYCARKKKKEVEKNKSEIKHLGLVENRSRPRIGGQVDHLCS